MATLDEEFPMVTAPAPEATLMPYWPILLVSVVVESDLMVVVPVLENTTPALVSPGRVSVIVRLVVTLVAPITPTSFVVQPANVPVPAPLVAHTALGTLQAVAFVTFEAHHR